MSVCASSAITPESEGIVEFGFFAEPDDASARDNRTLPWVRTD